MAIQSCENVVCSKAQRSAVELIVHNVEQLWETAEYEERESREEEENPDESVTKINAASYAL